MWCGQRSRLNNGIDCSVTWCQWLPTLLWILASVNGDVSFQFTQPAYNTTIPENPVGKVYITSTEKMGIFIFDPLFHVQYVIVHGNEETYFVAEDQKIGDFWFLHIRTNTRIQVPLNRESKDVYVLHVQASINSEVSENVKFTVKTEVHIKILDTNDLTPLFYPSVYTVSIPEDTPVHQSVARVNAVDPDVGINGEIYYSFQNMTFQFAIHPTTGVVTLTRPLSIEKISHYNLIVLAQDRGFKPEVGDIVRRSSASLKVVVNAVNQYPPDIHTVNLPTILRNDLLHVYAIVRVVDRDRGMHGHIRSVEIIDGDPFEYFQITKGEKSDEYTITISENLQHASITSQFNLTLKATDKGVPPKSSLRIITVRIPHYDDRPLIFDSPEYTTTIEEIAPVNTSIISVKAKHPDGDENVQIFYRIEDGNQFNFFTINKRTGLVTTVKPLDREKNSHYSLFISAEDQIINGLKRKGTSVINIKILDNNDNNPIFNSSSFVTVHLEENKPIGSVVYTAYAYDPDDGDNGYVSYHLANINYVPFEVDHFTGQIKTKEVLDFETMRTEYLLKVWASDWGTPFRRQSEVSVRVLLVDVNDHRPQFEKVDCIGYVSKTASIHTELLTVSAVDFDADSSVTYKMVPSGYNRCFQVHAITGILSLTCDLSENIFSKNVINISATDGQHYSDVLVISIKVVDPLQHRGLINKDAVVECRDDGVTDKLKEQITIAKKNNQDGTNDVTEATPSRYGENLHSPQFYNGLPMEIVLKENLPIGTEVLKISAEDHDHGYNGKLVYVISNGNDDSCFKIDMHSGKLVIIGELDREITAKYMLNISVFDLGQPPQATSTVLHIVVKDVNDNVPVFDRSAYDFSLFEDTPNETVIAKLIASDADSGPNGQLVFSLATDTKDFYIDKAMGTLSVHGPLDRERINYYRLKVRVSDSGSEEVLSSYTVVNIEVQDVNDNSPSFPLGQYLTKLREDIPIGSVVMSLSATDPDLNDAGTVSYVLLNDKMGIFTIDKQMGIIRLNRKLDYEERQIYNLTVLASDLGVPMQSSSAFLLVEVEDVNENNDAPVFNERVATGAVSENQASGTFVMQVKANNDNHRNWNDKVAYFLEAQEGTGLFRIDEEGIIWTEASLDREEQPHYWLSVYAQNKGAFPFQTRLDLYIEVLDENDNVPLTDEPIYYPSVVERADPGTTVIRLNAFDQDLNSQDGLTFNITAGNAQGFFVIDRTTGIIQTTGWQLDRETQEEHILEVTVTDSGTPALSSTTRVVVTVADINDHDPEFLHHIYLHCTVLPTNISDKEHALFRVVAMDHDEGPSGSVTYGLEAGEMNNIFHISPISGTVTVKKPLEAGEEYDLRVRATDGGQPQRSTLTRVVINVLSTPKSSPNPPLLKLPEAYAKVSESEKVGHLVVLIDVEDPDGDKLWYSITNGNEEHKFTMRPDERGILLAEPLDWETCSYYNLTVRITDGVYTVTTKVYVEVQDYNDHPPVFEQMIYHLTVSENVEVGTILVQLSATDLDQDKRLFYSLYNSAATSSLRMFHLDEVTGVLSVMEELDHELIHQHILTVLVKDRGTPAKRNFARVIIDVEDHNDHSPEFLLSLFEAPVLETAAVGTSVVKVSAFDRDKGRNAQICFSLISGNFGNAFMVDPNLGTVLVARKLDRLTMPEYFLVLKASDNGLPSLSSTVHVRVVVTLADDAAPKFSNEDYSVNIYENVKVGTVVMTVSATSRSSVYYEITSGNEEGRFCINPHSGVIFTISELDYEQNKYYNLTIQAINLTGRNSSRTALIQILDYNDNRPIFLKLDYHGEVSEAAEVGALVYSNDSTPLVIVAGDKDSNINCHLHYEIVENIAKNFFKIDSSTGTLRVARHLDYEKMSEFHFRVQVFDSGSPRLEAETTAHVHVRVTDTNDSPPQFELRQYDAYIFLPTYNNVVVTRVKAHDVDFSINSVLKYKIVSGNTGGKFFIKENSGEIFLKEPRALQNYYSLIVSVSDGIFEASTKVVIRVRKTENSGLVFDEIKYTNEIFENTTEVMIVAVITVLSVGLNEHLTFNILNPSDMFDISSTSGVLRTTGRPFDREVKERYTLVVEVRGDATGELQVAHVLVEVTVLDVNDNVPIFVNLPYYAVAPVEAQHGDLIWKVQAVDNDLGLNKLITYKLARSSTDIFAVDGRLGEIRLQRPVRTDVKEYILTIIAVDNGDPPLQSEATVHIKVISQDTPIFLQHFFSRMVPENTCCNIPLLSLGANSPYGHQVVYSIVRGNEEDLFDIDFQNGVIFVTDELDYETSTEHYLTVRSTDSATGAHTEVLVHIVVEDINDHSPVFTHDSYNVTISEAVPFGTTVLTVQAKDDDKNASQMLQYSILGRATAFFHVDSIKGNIIIKHSLDHEVQSFHHFVVMVADNGSPSLSTTADVWVTVTDVNDNPPRFGHADYSCEVSVLVERDHFVTMVDASDMDATDQLKLLYSIVGGNDLQAFYIHRKTGIIAIASPRQFIKQSFYTLNVTVTDGVYSSYTAVSVNARSENQHSPVFDRNKYEALLKNDVAPGTLVATVSATDIDKGVYGQMEFSIPSQKSLKYFYIAQKTGQLYTKRNFNRERFQRYEIPVKVSDGGGRTGYSLVRVTVIDVSYHSLEFSTTEYVLTISSNTTVGSSILKTQAFDPKDTVGGNLVYSIYRKQDSFLDTVLGIQANHGVIYLKRPLMGQEGAVYQFFVKAEDKMSLSQEAQVPVTIRISAPQIVIPRFKQHHYEHFVSESAEIGTIISILNTSSFWPIVYTFTPVKAESKSQIFQSKFSVNKQGHVLLMSRLDREEEMTYFLTVKANIQENPQLASYVNIKIIVLDDNDNIPKFESNQYSVKVAENVEVGCQVLRLVAHDEDIGQNADITYSFGLYHDDDDFSEVFSLDGNTGWLTTMVPLDYESRSRYNFTIAATDNGSPALSSVALVSIEIQDYNDNPTTFKRSFYEAAIYEDAEAGTDILVLDVDDRDSERVKHSLAFYITKGNLRDSFRVQKTGELYVNTPLDRELIPHYDLEITVTDGKYVSTTLVSLDVLDANDNPTMFLKSKYTAVLPENIPVQTSILQLEISDADTKRNAHALSFLTGKGAKDFVINPSTAVLNVVRPLDREKISQYYLQAHVLDSKRPHWESICNIKIILNDVNDNAPSFTAPVYSVSVSEDSRVGTLVMKIHAVDRDKGRNRKLSYEFIYSAEETFSIDKKNGIVRLNKKLDRERVGFYNLTVKVTDHGIPQLSSVAAVYVQVQDINDNPPVFNKRHYRALVSEEAELYTEVIQVLAVSIDAGNNAEITYSISSGNDLGHFEIHQKSGVITVTKHLDYEDIQDYFLTIEAKDGGTSPLTTHATVNISVIDANDNAPIYSQASYQTIIREDASVGDRIIQVKASDIDSAPNAQLSYFIIEGDRYRQFYVDREEGYIEIAAPLDRETISKYALEVECRDSGTPYLWTRVLVDIEISDVNDNPPVFSKTNYSVIIQENKEIGFPVITFSVNDKDTVPNTGPFIFGIISGNEDNSFRILPQERVLETAKKFSYQYRSNYTLCIQVTDAGLPPLSSQAWVTVLIVEESRFAPNIIPLEIIITSFGVKFPGGILGRVRATDEDPYDTLSFDISSPHKHLFQIDHEDGTLSSVPSLDPGFYMINVSVTDDKFTTSKTITIQNNLLTEEAIKHGVVIRIASISSERFLLYYKEKFLEFVRRILNVPLTNVQIISIQKANMNNTKTTRGTHPDLDVFFCIREDSSVFYSSNLIRSKLKVKLESFQKYVGLEIQEIMDDWCTLVTCVNGKCIHQIMMDESEIKAISTDTWSFVSHHFYQMSSCHCEPGYGGPHCERGVSACTRRPCPLEKVCIPAASTLGYVCECPKGKTGTLCDREKNKCNGSHCYEGKNVITFGGKSFAQYTMNAPVDHHFTVHLHIRTVQATGNLMFASGRKDYSILEMINGAVQFRVDFGSGEGIVRVEDIKVNDGTWHEVKVERRGNTATVTVDDLAKETGVAPGFHDLLNLDGNDLYFGAEARSLRYDDVRMGFIGCMADIRINGVVLPLNITSTNNVSTLRRFVNIEFRCGELVDLGICGIQPCLHGGTCQENESSFICLCLPRFLGINCEIDTDPCASNPCLYGGTCRNQSNGYHCECLPGHSGTRCGYGHFCNPNPCQNGGICEEGTYGPVCKCQGFHGDRCQLDLDECQGDPCGVGATCINFHGMFQCHCQPNMTGPLCTEPLFTASITSTSMNTTLEEIIGIVLMAVFLLAVSVGMVCCCKRYHRKCHQGQRNNNLQDDSITNEMMVKNSVLHRDDHKHINKLTNIEDTSFTRPTVPPRPKGYTPSIQESFNNLDTARSYEQVSEDLETFPRYSKALPRIKKRLQTIRNLSSVPKLASSDKSGTSNNTIARNGLEEKVQNDDRELKNEDNLEQDYQMHKSYSGASVRRHHSISITSFRAGGVVREPDGKVHLVSSRDEHHHTDLDRSYEKLKCDKLGLQAESERTIPLHSCQSVEFYTGVTPDSRHCTVTPSSAHEECEYKDISSRACNVHCNHQPCTCLKEPHHDFSDDDDIVSYGFPSQGCKGFMLELAYSISDPNIPHSCDHGNLAETVGQYPYPATISSPISSVVPPGFRDNDDFEVVYNMSVTDSSNRLSSLQPSV